MPPPAAAPVPLSLALLKFLPLPIVLLTSPFFSVGAFSPHFKLGLATCLQSCFTQSLNPLLLVPVTLLLLDLLYLPFAPAALLALITDDFSPLLILLILANGRQTFLVPPPVCFLVAGDFSQLPLAPLTVPGTLLNPFQHSIGLL